MEQIAVDGMREQLLGRRQKLQDVLENAGQAEELTDLLEQVDQALDRIEKGTYGLCETCHDSIEIDRLTVDPLIKNCLDHLTAGEQRLLERDLDLAYVVQSNLLPPRDLASPSWKTAYHYSPAGPVSGDYCDLFSPHGSESCLYFMVGDVSGKGVAASILMAQLHAIFRSLIAPGTALPTVLEQANRLFCEATAHKHFATLVAGRVDEAGRVELCNAAHCRPLVVRHRSVDQVAPKSLPLGLFAHAVFPSQQFQLDHGDQLVLYTDGIIEARNTGNDLYSEERLVAVAEANRGKTPTEIIDASLADVSRFTAGRRLIDDVTMMVLQRN